MKELVPRWLLLCVLYVLASPVYAVATVRQILKRQRAEAALRLGVLSCPYDETPVPLARMNTCPACGLTAPSSLVLPCEYCGEGPFPFVQCPTCGATLSLEVP